MATNEKRELTDFDLKRIEIDIKNPPPGTGQRSPTLEEDALALIAEVRRLRILNPRSSDRLDWMRVIKTQAKPGGGWGIAVMIDGYYSNESDADHIAKGWAEELELPLGHALKPPTEEHRHSGSHATKPVSQRADAKESKAHLQQRLEALAQVLTIHQDRLKLVKGQSVAATGDEDGWFLALFIDGYFDQRTAAEMLEEYSKATGLMNAGDLNTR